MSCPSGHKNPHQDSTCKWCLMALHKDKRYLSAWWPILYPQSSISNGNSSSIVGHVTESKPVVTVPQIDTLPDCIHLGKPTEQFIECPSCQGNVRLRLHECSAYGLCTLRKPAGGIACCEGRNGIPCEERKGRNNMSGMRWAYGVMTVPQRENDLLPQTLESLSNAGFNKPRLFVDGSREQSRLESRFGLEVTVRHPSIRTAGNWVLSIYELYYRDPNAERYALFQDDMVTYRNLRAYLERCRYPEKGYWNLYTFPSNESLSNGVTGWYLSNQFGRGAVALIFDRPTLVALLGSQHMAKRPQDCQRGWKAIDGGIVTALAEVGIKEYVHCPSLVQHTGKVSVMGNKPHLLSNNFLGESFDALKLLEMQNSPDGENVLTHTEQSSVSKEQTISNEPKAWA
jgi:hypothetical protein